jgi:hypothetical protein
MDLTEANQALLANFVVKLCEKKSIEITRGATYSVKINSEKIDHKNFDKFLLETLAQPEFSEFRNVPYAIQPSALLWDYLKRSIKQYQVDLQRGSAIFADGFSSFDYSQLRPFVSVDKDSEVTFVHITSREIFPLSYKNYEKFVPKNLQQEPIFGKIVFDPYSPEKFRMTEFRGQNINLVNTYHPPE